MKPAVAEWAGEHATAGLTYKTFSGPENVTLSRDVSSYGRLAVLNVRPSRPSGTDQNLDD